MATRDDLKSFLVTDIPTRITTTPIVAYEGQIERVNSDDFEARVQYLYREKIRNASGYLRHHLMIHLLSNGWDKSEEDTLTDTVEDAADEMVDDYNGKVSVFRAGLAGKQIARAKARRETPLQTQAKRKNRREAFVKIEVDEFEA
jgi:hypothetical protein